MCPLMVVDPLKFAFAIPTVDSPPERFRILEIGLRSADLKISKHANTYINLWIHPDRMLQTGVSKLGGPKPAWEEKFVFSIPDNFFRRQEDAAVYFRIYRARKYAWDSLVGTGRCNLKSLLDHQADHDGDSEKEAVYDMGESDQDLEEKNSLYDDDLDDDFPYSPARNKEEDDDDHIKGAPELRASTAVRISKNSESKGELSLDVTVWKGYINSVGGSKWCDIAMTYDGFMGHVEEKKNKKKKAWTCFANGNTKDD